MKTIRILMMVAIVLGMNLDAHAMGWSKIKFWKKKDVACVDDCVNTDCCVDDCVTQCEPRRGKFSRRCKNAFSASRHWLSDACKKDRLKIRRIKWLRGDGCVDGCIDSCVDDSCVFTQGCADQWLPAIQDPTAPKKVEDAPRPKQPMKLPQMKPQQQKKPLKSPTIIPTPKLVPKVKKKGYVPAEDATSFIMPMPIIQKLAG